MRPLKIWSRADLETPAPYIEMLLLDYERIGECVASFIDHPQAWKDKDVGDALDAVTRAAVDLQASLGAYARRRSN